MFFFFLHLLLLNGDSARLWAIASPFARVSRQLNLYDVRNSAPPLSPNLKGQRISASRTLPAELFRRGCPYQDLA